MLGASDSEHAVKMVKERQNKSWGDITKESEEMQIEALKEAYEEHKGNVYGESFPQ